MKNWKDLLIAGLLGVLLGQGVNMAYAEEAAPEASAVAPAPAVAPAEAPAEASRALAQAPAVFTECTWTTLRGATTVPEGWTVMGYSTALLGQSFNKSPLALAVYKTEAETGHYMMVCR